MNGNERTERRTNERAGRHGELGSRWWERTNSGGQRKRTRRARELQVRAGNERERRVWVWCGGNGWERTGVVVRESTTQRNDQRNNVNQQRTTQRATRATNNGQRSTRERTTINNNEQRERSNATNDQQRSTTQRERTSGNVGTAIWELGR